jgi:hypothetical protein
MLKRCTSLVLLAATLALVQGGALYGAWNPLGDPALIGWWSCDEGAGNVVGDSSANGNDGTFVNGDPVWTPGVFGNAITLVAPTLVEVPAMGLTLNEATMAGWFMPYGVQPDWAAIIMHRNPGKASGFNLLGDGQLAYHWNDSSATWSYRSGAIYSSFEWTFCTVTVAPDKATFYINGEAKGVNNVVHDPAVWDGPVWLGGDGNAQWVARRMNGSLDDVSFFSRALTAEEVQALMLGTAGAAKAQWENTAKAAAPTFVATDVADGVYDIGELGGEISYEFVVQSNPDETNASMCLIGRRNFGATQAGIKYEQWENTKTYGATLFGVVDLDFAVPTAPGVATHLTFVSSEATGTTALYVNGIYKASVEAAITLSGKVGIGYCIDAEDGSAFIDDFDGQIFGVAIYNRALTQGEIRLHSDAFALLGPRDITTPGDPVVGIPSGLPCGGDANKNYSPCGELPPLVIDNDAKTKYLNFAGNFGPNEVSSGFVVTPSLGATIVTGMTFTTANDAPERDPIGFELYGSNESADGPFELIASGFIMDFAMPTAWPRFTMNAEPITFENTVAYSHYQVLFTALRDAATANSMQIAEVELIGLPEVPKFEEPNVPEEPTTPEEPNVPETPAVTAFSEDFEAYAAGSALAGQGGWKGWAGDAAAGAPASDAFAFSGKNSVQILGSSDFVHEFAVAGGVAEFSAMQYIPSGGTGETFFILMNQYNDPGNGLDWSVQVKFNLANGAITADQPATPNSGKTIAFDKWVQINLVINLAANTVDMYYDGVKIATGIWDDNVHGTLQAVDLFGNGASSVYYDDIVITTK